MPSYIDLDKKLDKYVFEEYTSHDKRQTPMSNDVDGSFLSKQVQKAQSDIECIEVSTRFEKLQVFSYTLVIKSMT